MHEQRNPDDDGRRMRFLIVGAGNIGETLGRAWRAWRASGHDVRFGVPEPTDPKYAELPHERLNQTGVENIAGARAYHPTPVMFVAGDDPARKRVVLELVPELGFESVDAGPLTAARLLEPLAMLWIALATKRGQARDFAFAPIRYPKTST